MAVKLDAQLDFMLGNRQIFAGHEYQRYAIAMHTHTLR